MIDQLAASNTQKPSQAVQSSSTFWTTLPADDSQHTRSCSAASASSAEPIFTPSTQSEEGQVTLPNVIQEANLEAWSITVDEIPASPKSVKYNQQRLPLGQDTIRFKCRSWVNVWGDMEQLKPRVRENVMSLCLTLDAEMIAPHTFDKKIEVDYGTIQSAVYGARSPSSVANGSRCSMQTSSVHCSLVTQS